MGSESLKTLAARCAVLGDFNHSDPVIHEGNSTSSVREFKLAAKRSRKRSLRPWHGSALIAVSTITINAGGSALSNQLIPMEFALFAPNR